MKKTVDAPRSTEVVKYVHDIDRGVVEVQVRLTLYDGSSETKLLPRGDLQSTVKLRQVLDPTGVNYSDAELDILSAGHTIDPDMVAHTVSRPGWRPGGAYAWPGRSFREAGRKLKFHRAPDDELLGAYEARAGDIETWNGLVCPAIAMSDYAVFACGVSFAAAILRFSNAPEGALFAFSGESGVGKTGSSIAAQAVMGTTDRHLMVSWDATRAGLKDLLAGVHDFAIILDDTSRDGLPANERLRFFHDVSHALAGGGKRTRAKAYETQQGPAVTRRPALGLTSGEISPDELAKAGGIKVQGGARVRFIDIPVPKAADGGVFNRAVQGKEPNKIVPTAHAASKAMEAALGATYGVSFPVYVGYLEAHHRHLAARVRKYERAFIKSVKARQSKLTSSELRLAQKFGLVLAGLQLAIKAGAASWTAPQVKQAVMTCFSAALRQQVRERRERSSQVRALRAILRDRKRVPRIERGEAPSPNALGFRRKLNGREAAYMRSDQIGQALGIDEQQVSDLTGHLLHKGALLPNGSGERTRPTKVGGKQTRYYVFDRSFFAKAPKSRKTK